VGLATPGLPLCKDSGGLALVDEFENVLDQFQLFEDLEVVLLLVEDVLEIECLPHFVLVLLDFD